MGMLHSVMKLGTGASIMLMATVYSILANPLAAILKGAGLIVLTSPPVDLRGKVAIVTGSSTGIGRATAAALASNGATVILAVRSVQRGEDAKEMIINDIESCKAKGTEEGLFPRYLASNATALAPAGSVKVMKVDVSDLESVRAFAATFVKEHPRLDILVNNAGINNDWKGERTAQGDELVYGTNYVGPWLLTHLLLPHLKKSPEGRVVNVASVMHRFAGPGLLKKPSKGRVSKGSDYADSKMSNVLHILHLRRLLAGTNVTAVAVNPGYVHSDLWREVVAMPVIGPSYTAIMRFFALAPAQGCVPSVAAASHPLSPGTRYLTPFWVPFGTNKLWCPFECFGPTFGAMACEPGLPANEADLSERLYKATATLVAPFAAPL